MLLLILLQGIQANGFLLTDVVLRDSFSDKWLAFVACHINSLLNSGG